MRRTPRASKLLTRHTRKISVTDSALKELKSLPNPTKTIVVKAITKIAEGARPDMSWRRVRVPDSAATIWEKRVGLQSRVLFTLDDDRQEASVLAIITPGRISKVVYAAASGLRTREVAATRISDLDE